MGPTGTTRTPTPTGLPMVTLDRTAMRDNLTAGATTQSQGAESPQDVVSTEADVAARFAELTKGYEQARSKWSFTVGDIQNNFFPVAEQYSNSGNHDLAAKTYEEALKQCQFSFKRINYNWVEHLRSYTPAEKSYIRFEMELREKIAEAVLTIKNDDPEAFATNPALETVHANWALEHLTKALKIAQKILKDDKATYRIAANIGDIYAPRRDSTLQAFYAFRTAVKAFETANISRQDSKDYLLESVSLYTRYGKAAANIKEKVAAFNAFIMASHAAEKLGYLASRSEPVDVLDLAGFALRECEMKLCASTILHDREHFVDIDEAMYAITRAADAVKAAPQDDVRVKLAGVVFAKEFARLAGFAVSKQHRSIAAVAYEASLKLQMDLETLIAHGENLAYMLNYVPQDDGSQAKCLEEAIVAFKAALKMTDDDRVKAKLHFYLAKLERWRGDIARADIQYVDIMALRGVDDVVRNKRFLLLQQRNGGRIPNDEIKTEDPLAKEMALKPEFATAAIDIDNGMFGPGDVRDMLAVAQGAFFTDGVTFEKGLLKRRKHYKTTLEALKALQKAGYLNNAEAVMAVAVEKTRNGDWSEG